MSEKEKFNMPLEVLSQTTKDKTLTDMIKAMNYEKHMGKCCPETNDDEDIEIKKQKITECHNKYKEISKLRDDLRSEIFGGNEE